MMWSHCKRRYCCCLAAATAHAIGERDEVLHFYWEWEDNSLSSSYGSQSDTVQVRKWVAQA